MVEGYRGPVSSLSANTPLVRHWVGRGRSGGSGEGSRKGKEVMKNGAPFSLDLAFWFSTH